MGEANFYYFTCLKLPFDNLPSRLPLLLRMHWISVIAFVAVFASQNDAMPCWTTEICSAYFKAIGMVTDISKLPVGQSWEDKVCIQDPSLYLSCKLFNGVISGELQQCPPGTLFDQYAMKPWDKTCVPASERQQKKCPDWILKAASMKSSTEVVNRITHGSHGCIDCVIGECHQCLCRDALKWSFNSVATVVDPNDKAGNQYLVCEGSRITCHACPKGLVWNCRLGVCARTAECPPTPAKCQAYDCPATAAPLWVYKQPTTWIHPTPVRPYGMTKQQCICREALKFCSRPTTCVCDPYSETGYLECHRDRTVVARSCTRPGTCFNYLLQICTATPLCRPIPAVCKAL